MRSSPKGKYVNVDTSNSNALAICDYSGFVFNRCDLVRQMAWRGNALVWTGFLVGRPFVDTPNEQARPPILPPDPVPVKYARPPQGQTMTHSNNTLPVHSMINYTPSSLTGDADGVIALSGSERLFNLQNIHWGG